MDEAMGSETELGGVSSTTCSVDGSSGYFSSKWAVNFVLFVRNRAVDHLDLLF